MSQHTAARAPRERRALIGWTAAGVLVVLVAVLGLGGIGGGGGIGGAADPGPGATGGSATGGTVAADVATDGDLATGELPLSSTYTTVDAAPPDPDPGSTTDGIVVHPIRETPVHDAPDGRAVARMATTQFGDTWLPVIGEAAGWVHVLLPSEPNGSTGWLRAGDVERARSPYVVEVHLGSKRLELIRDGETVDEWPVAVGKPGTPTPAVRTFLLGVFRDDGQDYSPVILPLGAHSPTLDTFGGGPGTVAIHTWPDEDVFGTAVSDGCIRVPAGALDQLSEVPLGTLVMIDPS